MNRNNNFHATQVAGIILLGLLFIPSVVNAANTSSYDSSINEQSADRSNHTHSNSTENSTNSTEHAHANLTITAAIIQNGTQDVTVNIEDFEKNNPVDVHPHGLHARFFRPGAQNLSFESISISAAYCEMDLNGINEKDLRLFIYENSTWTMLPTDVNEEENILNASARSLSLFAISSHSENNSEHIHNATVQTVKSHDCEEMGDETISVSFIGREKTELTLEVNSNDMPDSSPPGSPVKFFSISARNYSYSGVNIKVTYNDAEFTKVNESNLSIIHYTNSTWVTLPTEVDSKENNLINYVESLSLFAISSLSGTGGMGMGVISNCLRCHGTNSKALGEEMMGGLFPKINQDIMNQSIHSNINDSSSNLNRACWACHSNSTTPPKKHPMHKPALTCASCHVNDSGKIKSPLATEHTLHATNISVNASCQLCHGKSQMINLNGSTLNSTISHYGKKRTDMIDLNKTNTNCSYCHQDPDSEFSDVFNKTSRTNIIHNGGLSCSSCHGTGRLHNSTIANMQGYSLSNCVQCHGTGGFAPKKINETVMNLSIHANLNNASSSSNLNQACWACHSNSSEAPDTHPGLSEPANTCSTCHVNNTVLFSSPEATEHTTHAVNITVNATCQLCHRKSQMINFNASTVNSTISHYGKNRTDMLDLNKTSTNCSYCHQNPASEFSDVFNKISRTNITHNGGLSCSSCHSTGRLHNSTIVNMTGYTLSNCVKCHGTDGFASNKVSESTINKSLHANLNGARSELDRACWACHSNIITAPNDHPDIGKPPNTCSSCHIEGELNLTGKIKRGHISSHSPGSSQIRTPACTTCHINDVLYSGKTVNSSVSHFAKYPTIDTKDCISCHQNERTSQKWGNPPDPRETIRLSSIEKKLVSDDTWRINENYSISIADIDKEGKSIWVELYYNGLLIKDELVTEGGGFKYENRLVQEGENKTIIDMQIPEIFYGGMVSLITFKGYVPTHIHTETTSVQCYACHVKEYRADWPDGQKYSVLKKDEQNVTLSPIDIDFDTADKKMLYSNNSWNMGNGYELYMKDFSPDNKNVWLVLTKDNIKVKEEFVTEGEYFTYNTTLNDKDITILRLKIANIFVKG